MSESPLDEDQEIAENILNRIFYEQTTHDRIIALLRSYKDQDFGYLDACTELSHVFLRLLERYSKQNVDMQVRSRRRVRKKKRAAQATEDPSAPNEEREKEVEDIADAQRAVTERKFDFHRFSARFINQTSVDTFVALLRHYHDLTNEQLKRCHRFFYRIAFKMELTVFLFRMDIIQLLNKLVKGPEGLNIEVPTFKEWEELIRQVFRRLVKRMEERPALAVELLFSKIPSTMFYLEHGYEKELPKKVSSAAAELEVKPGLEREEQLGVAVSILINQSKSDALAWAKDLLSFAASERKSWEEANTALTTLTASADGNGLTDPREASEEDQNAPHPGEEPTDKNQTEAPKAPSIIVKADTPERTKAMHQDKHLRLLLTVLALEKLTFDSDAIETTWIIPSAIPSAQLSRDAELIAKFEFDLPTFEEGKSAEDMIRRKQALRVVPRPRPEQNDDSEGSTGTDIEEGLFPAGGPTIAPNQNPKTKRLLRRQKRSADETLDPEILEARRKAKSKSEAEKNAKIKSGLYIHESDDEEDEERDRLFFEKERAMREKVAAAGGNLGYMAKQHKYPKPKKGKRKAAVVEDETVHNSEFSQPTPKKRKTPKRAILVSDDESDAAASHPAASFAKKTRRSASTPQTSASNSGHEENASSAETDTETPPSSQRPSRGLSSAHSSQARKIDMDAGSGIDVADSGSDKENAPKNMPAPARRNVKAGFIIDSDSDD